jgi:hypothetical protein
MKIIYLTKKLAIIYQDKIAEIGSLLTFAVPLPFRKEDDYFFIHGVVFSCVEHAEDKTSYRLQIVELTGATEQDEMILNAYVIYEKTKRELEIIRLGLEKTLENTKKMLDKTIEDFNDISVKLACESRRLVEFVLEQQRDKATLH